ncbi:MAG: hypothetical protein JWQ02_739 [Capsulimonas sp.]|jgi:hypothetical protein|nr:hypothetical protein [Capsulimonas sp.]
MNGFTKRGWFALCAAAALSAAGPSGAASLRALVLSGGPDLEHNQAAIESNVRYVDRLLPKDTQKRILFTDGDPKSKNVLCEDDQGKTYYRIPQLPRLDGANELPRIESEFETLASGPPDEPVLLYVTGHGSPGAGAFDNNHVDLWNKEQLNVRDLAAQIKTLPEATPVAVVMVQCFSGCFGNLLFEGGDPKAPLVNRDLCGFFASVAERPAAGCTAAVHEADYHDFTGYFFAALSGESRLGQPVTGCDYNHDGRVGMDEAYCYTLIHDDSIDTPVCTSDVFLRRFVPAVGFDFTETSWSDLRAWAAPAQRAALDALSDDLKLSGETRLTDGLKLFQKTNAASWDLPSVHVIRFMRLAKTVVLAHWLMTSEAAADQPIKSRYKALTAAEARSCLAPSTRVSPGTEVRAS